MRSFLLLVLHNCRWRTRRNIKGVRPLSVYVPALEVAESTREVAITR
jgi:hypothetical protein